LDADILIPSRNVAGDPVLICPNEDKPFVLQTDASACRLGAVLHQQDNGGEERQVVFFSRKFLQYESNYLAIEKECLAIVAAIRHFSVYSVGREFSTVTDHHALHYLNSKQNSNPRLTHWVLFLQPYSFTVVHRPGFPKWPIAASMDQTH